MQAHPFALLFPSMSREEYSELSTDIAKNGLIEPITTYQGMVLDGRNRDQICHGLGITPKTVEFKPSDGQFAKSPDEQALAFVISKNLHRRHLKSSQRAMVAASLLEHYETLAKEQQKASGGDRKSPEAKAEKSVDKKVYQPVKPKRAPQAIDQAAKAVGTNRQYVSAAKAIAKQAPDLAEKIEVGEMTIPQAKKQLLERQIGEPIKDEPKIIRRSAHRFNSDARWKNTTLPMLQPLKAERNRWPTSSLEDFDSRIRAWLDSLSQAETVEVTS